MQFDKISKQYSKKFIKLNKLSIYKNSIKDFDIKK